MASSSTSRRALAVAALAAAIPAISWGSILVRLCHAPPLTVAFLRVAFATLILLPWADPSPPRAARARRVCPGAAIAGLCLAVHFATWIASLAYISIAASTLLVSTQPIFTMLLSRRVLREAPSGRDAIAVTLALLGIGLIAGDDLRAGGGRILGDLLAVAGAASAAVYLTAGRASRQLAPLPHYLLLVNFAAALGVALLALPMGQPLWPAERADLGWCLLMALVPHMAGHGLLNWLVRHLRAYVVSLAVLGEPVVASAYAYLVFGETPPPMVYPGALLIGAGVILALREAARRKECPVDL